MEQIVKIFVHQSYFIENDLIVDYNVEQRAHVNVSSKDWIALIPKGWSGVDEQVAFKTVNSDSNFVNLAIKSIVMEKKCFQNVVECEKQYQLMYIGQYLEILGKSEYFIFLHQSGICNCVSSSTKTENKGNSKPSRLTSVFGRKPLRRQSPTPREFYTNQSQSQNNIAKCEKSKHWPTNKCIKCNAPNNFITLENLYLTKIQDLIRNKEVMEQRLLLVEKDLVHTLDVINKQFKLNKVISQQKDNIQKFIDDVVDGLLNDGKITFWAHDQEFSVVREFPDKNQSSVLLDDCTALPIDKTLNSSKEAHMKAIIGQQEKTIQHLVNKIRDSFNLFLKVNTQSVDVESNNIVTTSSKNKLDNIGYMDSSGTTYFSPPSYTTDPVNDTDVYLSKNIEESDDKKENIETNEDFSNIELITQKSKLIHLLNKEVENKVLPFEDWEKNKNEYTLFTQSSKNFPNEKIESVKNENLSGSDDSF